ncbi:MAG TPA: alpha/beta fold hydrolase [Gemmatimonas sp.]|uniref:alpha/beta hydrolase n=1 Tax=Gemmatimonas sp. TaxID=1962908 RepID=UPI002EDB4E4D
MLNLGARRAAIAARFEQFDEARRPRSADGIVRGAEPFRLQGTNGRAVLVLHGFNDTPQSMRHLATRLHGEGYTVDVPRLPGHGGSLVELARDGHADQWRVAVRDAYDVLRRTHDTVHLCGQSMGGALATLEAYDRVEVRALVLLAPYLGMPFDMRWQTYAAAMLKPFTPYHRSKGSERSIHDPEARAQALGPGIVTPGALAGLRTVATAVHNILPSMTVPTLYIQSREDNRISVSDATRYFSRIGSSIKEQRWLNGCGHIISADYCRDTVADAAIAWFRRFEGPKG